MVPKSFGLAYQSLYPTMIIWLGIQLRQRNGQIKKKSQKF